MREVFAICADVQGTALIETTPYFTDATPALGRVPTVILGPERVRAG
jgi:hypothetical protein